MTLILVVGAGLLVGLALGALGGGGSILAVPVLVYLLDQSAAQATTGSLVVVGVASLIGAARAHRVGHVMLGRGAAFGLVATGGAALGALASSRVPEPVLLGCFSALVVVVAGVMAARQLRAARVRGHQPVVAGDRGKRFDEPVITFRPSFVCHCSRALTLLATATVVGGLTGFLGVGGGFLVVPALMLALSVPMRDAAGTSLVVITITAATALLVRAGSGPAPDWGLVAVLTVASAFGALLGARIALRAPAGRLQAAFTASLFAVGGYTALHAMPGLI